MFGDAFSPYLIGALSDFFKPLIAAGPTLDPNMALKHPTIMDRISYELTPQEYDREFRALEYSLFSCCFFQVRSFLIAQDVIPLFSGSWGIFLLCRQLVCDL